MSRVTRGTIGKRSALLWLPVICLPLANLVIAAVTQSSFTEAYSSHSALVPFLPVAVVLVLGAVAEELFFRWLLLKKIFLPQLRPTLAVLLASTLFACAHLWNMRGGQTLQATLLQVFFAFAFSVWAGVVTWKATWLIPLFAHALLNATAVEGGDMVVTLALGVFVLLDGLCLLDKRK